MKSFKFFSKFSKASLIIIAIVLVSFFASLTIINAQVASYKVQGWAWVSNIGWISVNCDNTFTGNTCSTNPYKVTMDSSGNLGGYAWSSVGWIKFEGDGSHSSPAVNLGTGAVTGWAHACTATNNVNTCDGGFRTDGWDGWIELSGNNHASPVANGLGGVTFTYPKFNGFAWGSEVVGWVSFDPWINPQGNAGPPPVRPIPGVGNCTGVCGIGNTVSCSINAPAESSGPVSLTVTMNNLPAGSYRVVSNKGNDPSPNNPFNSTGGATYTSPNMSDIITSDTTYSLSPNPSNACSPVTVKQNSGGLKLLIGATTGELSSISSTYFSSEGYSEITILSGRPFALKWNVNLNGSYTCDKPNISDPTANDTNNTWSGWKSKTVVPTSNNDTPSAMQTKGITPGTYYFIIKCNKPGTVTKASAVKLNIVTPFVEEI